MNRNMNRQNMRNNKPRSGQLKRTRNLYAQNANLASRRDAVPQLRKFIIYDTVTIDNTSTEFAFGYRAININGSAQPFGGIINKYTPFYEQYRVRKVICRAQCGKGFTNDLRIKSYVQARVDVDNQNITSTVAAVQSLLGAENAVSRTFTERGNVKIAEYRPIQRANISNLSEPFLPSNDQWYATNDVALHTWKGITLALVIPEPTILPNSTAMTLTFELDIEFRGRITDYVSTSIAYPLPTQICQKEICTTPTDVNHPDQSKCSE